MTFAMTTKKNPRTVYLDPALEADIKSLAKARQRSINNLVEVVLGEVVAKAKAEGEIK